MSLVHHVCQTTDGLQSLFLISKSNCAFANFPGEESCQAAQNKINDTWFGSVRLVSRLRKTSVENAQGIAPGPSRPTATATATLADSMTGTAEAISERTKKSASPSSLVVDGTRKSSTPTRVYDDGMTSTPSSGSEPSKKGDRYFILKSLTVDDLALSVRTGIWATQSHNEQVLNSAFNVSTVHMQPHPWPRVYKCRTRYCPVWDYGRASPRSYRTCNVHWNDDAVFLLLYRNDLLISLHADLRQRLFSLLGQQVGRILWLC